MVSPNPMPITDPIRPMIEASSRTSRLTWRRLAPRARISASSWVRCRTTIWKVL